MGYLIGYARVSTEQQDLDPQIDLLNAAGCQRIFADRISGRIDQRPQLTAALDHLRAEDTLIVCRLDRLGRSLPHLIHTVSDLRDRSIDFRSLSEGIDTSTPAGQFVFHLMGALAQFEAALVWERTQAGLAAARARGRVGGRPITVTKSQVASARELHASGKTWDAIATDLRVSRSSLFRALKREPAVT